MTEVPISETDGSPEMSPNDAQVPEPRPGMVFTRKPRFTTLRGVRREFAALYVDLLNGRVPQKVAGTAGNLLSGIVRALEVEVLERRLSDLEDRAGALPKTGARPHARH